MNIIWLSHVVPYPPKGGLTQRSYNLIKQTSMNHKVHLVSLNNNLLLPTDKLKNEAQNALKDICASVKIFDNIYDKSNMIWLIMAFKNYFDNNPYDVNWRFNPDLKNYINNLTSSGNYYDIVHVDTIGMFSYATYFKNTKIILNHHNIESDMMFKRYYREKNIIKKLYFKKEFIKLRNYEKIVCGNCYLNYVVSELDAIRLKEVNGNIQLKIIKNGVDVTYFDPNIFKMEDRKGLIFAGGMSYYPNKEAALFLVSKLLPLLKKNNIDMKLTIIGRNPPKYVLKEKNKYNLHVPGYVDDIRPYISSSKIYVCPINDGGGTRLKILDALAMGIPLVATKFSVEGIDMEEGIHYLRAESASDYVNQIKRLEMDTKLYKKLIYEGRKLIEEKYSWEVIGRDLEMVYKKIGDSKGV